MSSIVDADDRVVEAALAVLNGERAQGTEGIRRVVRDDGTDFVYRVDPDADPSESRKWRRAASSRTPRPPCGGRTGSSCSTRSSDGT